jgi:starvation-inducible DNA-binding protein
MTRYPSPSPLPEATRARIAERLEQALLDGLDLHGQIKVAHWNVKGPHFAALHPLFETFAMALAGFNDAIAERAVTLGARVRGTARSVVEASRIPDWPLDAVRDLDLVKLLADRFDVYLRTVREARDVAEEHEDQDTVDLLTEVATGFEKNTWFLRATLV